MLYGGRVQEPGRKQHAAKFTHTFPMCDVIDPTYRYGKYDRRDIVFCSLARVLHSKVVATNASKILRATSCCVCTSVRYLSLCELLPRTLGT